MANPEAVIDIYKKVEQPKKLLRFKVGKFLQQLCNFYYFAVVPISATQFL